LKPEQNANDAEGLHLLLGLKPPSRTLALRSPSKSSSAGRWIVHSTTSATIAYFPRWLLTILFCTNPEAKVC
ncbi:hypothetical protein RvY_17499, partial [Ramazzottius varieornatus]